MKSGSVFNKILKMIGVLLLSGACYLYAQSKRYTVIDPAELLVMDNWTKKVFVLDDPVYLNPENHRQTKPIEDTAAMRMAKELFDTITPSESDTTVQRLLSDYNKDKVR